MVCTNVFFFCKFLAGFKGLHLRKKGTGQYCLNYSETQERGALGELRGFKVK